MGLSGMALEPAPALAFENRPAINASATAGTITDATPYVLALGRMFAQFSKRSARRVSITERRSCAWRAWRRGLLSNPQSRSQCHRHQPAATLLSASVFSSTRNSHHSSRLIGGISWLTGHGQPLPARRARPRSPRAGDTNDLPGRADVIPSFRVVPGDRQSRNGPASLHTRASQYQPSGLVSRRGSFGERIELVALPQTPTGELRCLSS
jgi:hypothetical protein